MRFRFAILAAAGLLAAAPAFAGNLSFDNGQTTWHSTQCNKPESPASLMSAGPEAEGEQLNSLINQHNAFADAAQNYMNCISNESDRDQTVVNQEIATSAQKAIADMQAQVNQSSAAIRARQERNKN